MLLLRFAASNFRSLRDKQELSLVASSLKDSAEGLIQSPALASSGALPAAVIYGANASGKTNVISALLAMRSNVLLSNSRGAPEGGLPRKPFALDQEFAKRPTSMDADFVVNGVRYHYGFAYTDEEFVCEWLYSFPSGRQTILFRRENQRFTFGRSLKGRNRIIAELTRPNSLFLSTAAQFDHDELLPLIGFFRAMRADRNISVTGSMASSKIAEGEVDQRVMDFLIKVGTGVIGWHREQQEHPKEVAVLQREIASVVKRVLGQPIDLGTAQPAHRIELGHAGLDGSSVFFPLDDESAGTRRLLVLLGLIFTALDAGSPVIVDELDASLHTQAAEAIVALFSSKATNPQGAQLIATTHDTNILRSKYLRRDQIWFSEKDQHGATNLYPLTDFHTRLGDNLERGYLQGRYGALPFAGSLAEFVAEK